MEVEGEDVEAIPEGFREWLDVGRAELESLEQREQPRAADMPQVRSAIAQLRQPLPEEPAKMAAVVGAMIREELRATGLTCTLVFAATDTTLERWEAHGKLPCTVDDFMRSIAARDEAIVAIGHVGLVSFEINGQSRRGFFCDIERAGRRGRWMLPVMQEGDPLPQDVPGLEQELGELADAEAAWLGVAPKVGIDFSLLGFEDQLGLGGGTGIAEG